MENSQGCALSPLGLREKEGGGSTNYQGTLPEVFGALGTSVEASRHLEE